ncbi:MAG TPA: hypothetical protein VGM03_14335 [Phycisphaerae bacterium]
MTPGGRACFALGIALALGAFGLYALMMRARTVPIVERDIEALWALGMSLGAAGLFFVFVSLFLKDYRARCIAAAGLGEHDRPQPTQRRWREPRQR